MKRIIVSVLSIVLIINLIPFMSVSAAGNQEQYSLCSGGHSFTMNNGNLCGVCFYGTAKSGDLNLDDKINTVDLATMKLVLAALHTLGVTANKAADLSLDGTVKSDDLAKLKLTLCDATKLTRKVKLDVKYLAQNPELPTGCEITSLTTVLNFYGFNASKTDMADNYLAKSDTNKDFFSVFLGNPRKKTGFGCYAQPITDAANKYLTEHGSSLTAYNRSGASFEEILLEVQSGRPVVIWGTMNMATPSYTYTWILEDGTERRWIIPEHCLVLIGFDLDRNVAIMSDPLKGIVEYNLDTVKARYEFLHSQCVFIC